MLSLLQPLPTKLVLQKKKAKEGRSGDEVEHYPVPSRVTVRRRDTVAIGELKEPLRMSSYHVRYFQNLNFRCHIICKGIVVLKIKHVQELTTDTTQSWLHLFLLFDSLDSTLLG